jgi:transcriptional regulator, LysR family
LDWDRVRIFYAAAEAGSLTRAGEVLGLSQSAVSRQVSALESELDVPLFHRHARGLVLTEQGELLFRTARELVTKLEQTRASLSDSREKPNGELRVTAQRRPRRQLADAASLGISRSVSRYPAFSGS